MNKVKIAGAIVAGLAVMAFAGLSMIPADDGYDAGMITVCSDITKDQMKSPSSYIFNKAVISTRKANDSETESKLSETSVEAFKDLVRNGTVSYLISEIYVDYEAKNTFGTLLKNASYCRYDVMKSSSSSSYDMNKLVIESEQFMAGNLGIILAAKDSKIGKGGIMQKIDYLKLKLSGKI